MTKQDKFGAETSRSFKCDGMGAHYDIILSTWATLDSQGATLDASGATLDKHDALLWDNAITQKLR